MLHQPPIPQEYTEIPPAELERRIAERKAHLAEKLCILGHHYQSDAVLRFADFTGDSLKLSQLAADRKQAQYIVFCGVHFMAESADVLSSPGQIVVLPNMRAGCAMADMAGATAVAAATQELAAMTDAKIVPISYVNTTAAIKAITARGGGACCTSGNVRNVFEWALRPAGLGGGGADKILSVPDQHLGRNTAAAMGLGGPDDCVVYDPNLPDGGLERDDLDRSRFVLWKGHCYVHQLFTADHVRSVRARHEGITVIVHPECPREVVSLADAAGSTEQIIKAVAGGSAGARWAVGTESNLVNRLARRHKDQFVRVLSDAPAICAQMARIDLPHLLWALDNIAAGSVVNRVSVPEDIAHDARIALQRMIDIKPVTETTPSQ